jgi:hypothetical protein
MKYHIIKMSTDYGVWLETKPDYLKCLAVYLPYRSAQQFVKQHKQTAD